MGTEADAMDFRSLFEQKEKELITLCVQKEKELVKICEQQVQNLQQQVLERDKNIADLNAKFCSLKEDFKYNLELLDGRDVELSQYELELSTLQDSAEQATRNIQETHQNLAESERQRLQERSKAQEKDKLYQKTLLDMKGQMESLQLTREQLLTMHKQAFGMACAELKSEVEKKQVDMELHRKMLEAQTIDRLRIQELQSQLVLDGVKNKLSIAETIIKQMERQRDVADQEYSQAEAELRDTLEERDKIIKQMSLERKQLQSEKDNIKSKADLDSRKSTENLQHLEAEHQQQLLQMKSQMEDLQRRLESAESRLTRCGEQPRQIASYLAKVGQLEKEVMTYENETNKKLEGLEAFIREAGQLQDQKVQGLETEVAWWKSRHDILLSKFTSQQKQLVGGSTIEGETKSLNFLQVPQINMIYKKHDLPTTSYNLETTRPNITNTPLPHPQPGRGRTRSNSLGSSLPSPSPLPSPTFSIFEESLLMGRVNEAVQTNTQADDVVNFNKEDDYTQHVRKEDDGNLKLVSLATENQGLRKSVQNLKDQNELMRQVVGTLRADMEALQRVTLQKSPQMNNFKDSTICKEETRQLHDEANYLASEAQQLRQQKSKASLDQKAVELQDLTTEAIQKTDTECDKFKSESAGSQKSAAKIAELERVQKVLQMQLQSATADIIRMTNERDCLMEISNSLHADFNRVVHQTNFKNAPSPPRHHENLEHIVNPARDMAHSGGKPTTICSHRPHTSPQKVPMTVSPSQGAFGTIIQDPWLEASTAKGLKQHTDSHMQSRSMQPSEKIDEQIGSRWLHLEGKMTSLKHRPELLQDSIHKGVPSQRNKLKQSIKRRETQLADQMANRPRVRNYNIKDDDSFQQQLTHNFM